MANQTKQQFFTEKFDNDFRSIESEIVSENIFNRFPRMMPMVGADYEKQPAKLLLVLESYYFSSEDLDNGSVFLNEEDWYKTKGANLIPKISEKKVNMREEWICNRKEMTGPYPNIYRSLCAMKDGDIESQCRSIAIYNYFLRPAFNNNSNKGFGDNNYCTDYDRIVAYEAFCGIVDILKPDVVVFLSKFSFLSFLQYHKKSFINTKIVNVYHPSSPWWNKNGGVGGRQKFAKILYKYWLKNKPENFEKLRNIHLMLESRISSENHSEHGVWIDGNNVLIYYSKLSFNINNHSFFYQTSIDKNSSNFSTYFRATNGDEKLQLFLDNYEEPFPTSRKEEDIVAGIETLINNVINDLSKPTKQ